jgi:hypothetical protein
VDVWTKIEREQSEDKLERLNNTHTPRQYTKKEHGRTLNFKAKTQLGN